MIDIGVHIMEMAHYIMGSPRPISASGACHTYIGNKKSTTVSKWGPWDHKTYTVEDLAIGFVRFDDGSSLQIESSFAAHIEKDVHSIQIMGTEGGATYDPLKIFCDDGGYMVNLEPAFIANRDGFDYKMRHFVDCVRGDKTCEAPGEDGLLIQKIIDAVYKSAELQKEVAIK